MQEDSKRADHIPATVLGVEVTVSEYDGLPVKNHLPPEMGARFKTLDQWLALGMSPRSGAVGYRMHPSMLAKRLCTYYHEDDVVGAFDDEYLSRPRRAG